MNRTPFSAEDHRVLDLIGPAFSAAVSHIRNPIADANGWNKLAELMSRVVDCSGNIARQYGGPQHRIPAFSYLLSHSRTFLTVVEPVEAIAATDSLLKRAKARASVAQWIEILARGGCPPLKCEDYIALLGRVVHSLSGALKDLDDVTVLSLMRTITYELIDAIVCHHATEVLNFDRYNETVQQRAVDQPLFVPADQQLATKMFTQLRGPQMQTNVAHILSSLLDVVSRAKIGSEARTLAADCVALMLEFVLETGETAAMFLPSTASILCRTAFEDPKQNHQVVCASIYALTFAVSRALGDKNVELVLPQQPVDLASLFRHHQQQQQQQQQQSKPSTHQPWRITLDKTWFGSTVQKLSPMLELVCKSTRTHDHWKVRQATVFLCDKLVEECLQSLSSMMPLLLSTLVQCSYDGFQQVTDAARDSLDRIRIQLSKSTSTSLTELLEQCLYNHATELPKLARSGTDEQKIAALRMLLGFCDLLGDRLMTVTQPSSVVMQRVWLALFHVTELDASNILVTEAAPMLAASTHAAFQSNESIQEADLAFAGRPHLRRFAHFRDATIIQLISSICRVLARYGHAQSLLDALVTVAFPSIVSDMDVTALAKKNTPRDFSGGHRKQSIILLNILMQHLYSESSDAKKLHNIIKWLLPLYTMESLLGLPTVSLQDDPISLAELGSNALLQCLLCDGVQIFAQRLGKLFSGPFLIQSIYPLLQLVASPAGVVAWSAAFALNRVAVACGDGTVPALLDQNADYLVDHIARRLRYLDQYPEAAPILCELLKRAGPSTIPLVEDTLDEVFASLDGRRQQYTAVYMTVMHQLVLAVPKALPTAAKDADSAEAKRRRGGKHYFMKPSEKYESPLPWDHKSDLLTPAGLRARIERSLKLQRGEYEPLSTDSTDKVPASGFHLHPDPNEEGMGEREVAEAEEEEEEEEEEESAPVGPNVEASLPRELQLVRRVLEKCRFYMTCDDPVLRAHVVDTCTEAFRIMGQYRQDVLLPLVHIVWPSLRPLLSDVDHLPRMAAVHCVCQLLKVCGDFMRTRLVDFAKPVLFTLTFTAGLNPFARSHQVVVAALQCTLLMVERVPLDSTCLEDAVSRTLNILREQKITEMLYTAAMDVMRALNRLDHDLVWLVCAGSVESWELKHATAADVFPDISFKVKNAKCLPRSVMEEIMRK